MGYKKPKIAILLAAPDEKDLSIDRRYSDAVVRVGGIPLHVTSNGLEAQLDALVPDGVLLPGEQLAGQPNRVKAYYTSIQWAQKTNTCYFGVCAGMQLLARSLGGNLVPIQNHYKPPDLKHIVYTRQSRLLESQSYYTNTIHHYAVDREVLGEFNIAAEAMDGVIEAIEPSIPWAEFVLGVQWHPEKIANDMRLFESFINHARASR